VILRTSTIVVSLLVLAPLASAQNAVALRGTVHTGEGAALPDHGVLIVAGKITQVAPWSELKIPDGTAIVETPGGSITPGLIDACSTAGVISPKSWAEHGSEVVPHLRVLDAIDLASDEFETLARRGVTTVYVTAGPGSVIGSQGTVLKTAGPMNRRMLRKAGAIRASFGMESMTRGVRNHRPSTRGALDFATRRPTTRMGAVWVFRDAFSRTARGALKGPAAPILREVLEKTRPLRIQARTRDVIETAIRLTREFGIPFVLEEATEAYHLVPMLKANAQNRTYPGANL
jgi:imidazolonepropionase-like amidohydrolase